jgi:hypothetical protein
MKNNSVLDRFYNHTKRDEETGCLLWIGGLNDQGYGKFWFNNKPVRAHRWLFEYLNGKLPKNIEVCHKCDIRNCVEPLHMFTGTQGDNIRDCRNKNRMRGLLEKGEGNPSAKLTEKDVLFIRKFCIPNDSINGCKEFAKKFNVSAPTITNILKGRKWKYLLVEAGE